MFICQIVFVVALAVLSGCALAPYEETFQCPLSSDFGHCTDVGGAYDAAVAGTTSSPASLPPPRGVDRAARRTHRNAVPSDVARVDQDARHAQLAALIDTPVWPLLTPPKVLRTLVLSYQAADRTLFLPRYMFYLATESEFVLGEELNAQVDAAPSSPLFPTEPH